MVAFYRTEGLLPLDHIATQRVVMVGGGSLGSHSLMHLAFPWEQLVIIDPDILEDANVERHLLGYDSVGKYKVTGLKRWLTRQRRLDSSRITTHRTTVNKVLGRYSDVDLIIETTGIPSVRQLVNAWCVQQGIPAIYAGVYPRGTGGEVTTISDPSLSCLACYDDFDAVDEAPRGSYDVREPKVDPNTGEVKEAPYLSGPVAATAADVQDYALDILTGVELPNQCLIHTHKGDEICYITNQDVANSFQAIIDFESSVGFIPNRSIEVDTSEQLTLRGTRDKVPRIIQPSGWCPFHFSAAVS